MSIAEYIRATQSGQRIKGKEDGCGRKKGKTKREVLPKWPDGLYEKNNRRYKSDAKPVQKNTQKNEGASTAWSEHCMHGKPAHKGKGKKGKWDWYTCSLIEACQVNANRTGRDKYWNENEHRLKWWLIKTGLPICVVMFNYNAWHKLIMISRRPY